MYVSQKVLMMEGTTPVMSCLITMGNQSSLVHHQGLHAQRSGETASGMWVGQAGRWHARWAERTL